MTGNDFEEFLKKDISSQIDVFRNSSLDDKKFILLKLDPELRKNILTNISIDELKEFIIAVDFDKKIINLISNNLINSIFKSFTTDERDYKFKLLKSIDLNEDWFDSLLDSEKKDFIKSLSVKEIDDYIYYSKGNVRESIYQILGNNYIKDNISNMSFRSARVVIGMLESDIFRKESDIRVSEGAFNKHNKKDGENKNSMLDNMKKELDDMKNTLQVSKQAHEKNSTEFNQLIAEFSSKVAKLRSKIPRGEKSSFEKISKLSYAQSDLVRIVVQNGYISDEFFERVTVNLSDEDKAVFCEFKDKANAIMSGEKVFKEETKNDNKPSDKKVNFPKITKCEKIEKYRDVILNSTYYNSYDKNAFGWYFDPSVDDYVEGYDPLYDPLFNVSISDENRNNAMMVYESEYGKNVNGWYFDPSVDEYVEGYDPTLDPLFNKSLFKLVNINVKKNDNSKKDKPVVDDKKNDIKGDKKDSSQSRDIVIKLVNFLNNSKKFDVQFVDAGNLKSGNLTIDKSRPIIAISNKDKVIAMECIGFGNNRDKVMEEIKNYLDKSEEFGFSFDKQQIFLRAQTIEGESIISLTDQERKNVALYLYELKEKKEQLNDKGFTRIKSMGRINYQLIAIFIVILILIGIIFFIIQ